MNTLILLSHLKIVNLSFHLFIFGKSFLQAIFRVQVWILSLIYVAKKCKHLFNLLLSYINSNDSTCTKQLKWINMYLFSNNVN